MASFAVLVDNNVVSSVTPYLRARDVCRMVNAMRGRFLEGCGVHFEGPGLSVTKVREFLR